MRSNQRRQRSIRRPDAGRLTGRTDRGAGARVEFLRTTQMFAHVEEKLLCRIAGDMRERRLSKNETLFTEGELGDAVYTIVEGTIGLQCSGLTVLSRASGECVGEFAMLDGAPRSASAVAVTDAVLLEWSRNDFRAALQVSGGLTRGFFKTMTAKLRQRMTNPRAAAAAADRDAVARRRAVKEVFEVISRLPSADRDAYLEHHHPGDHALRAEVAELLEFESKLGDFMESDRGRFPAAGDASGRFLDRYRLDRRIGSGGMGEVYAGVDTQLGRPVAVKILPPHLAGFASFRRRFENEAQAIAALDHPNIVTIHSVEEADGVSFIVMELVSGRTLTELIANGGVAIADFFEIAIPLARAVADAHAHGITHRDLKPDNIMVDERGTVKVLDFGLAKTAPLSGADGDDGRPTLTKAGEIVGTVPYMSPEQAEGKSVDERSDVFTLGINFYELLSGCYPFEGDSATSVMASILRDEPKSLTELNPKIPSGLSELVARCLDKTADRRYPARVVVEELERIQRSVTVPALAGACRTSM